jgi:hypothetical protein
MQEPPADETPPPARWSLGPAALVAAAVILAVLVVLTLLGQAGVLPESEAAGLDAVFLGVCGLVAGLVGAGERRKQRWPGATIAYRVAMWCFFLASLHAVKYHVATQREAGELFEKLKHLKEQHKGPEAAPQDVP